MTVRRSHVTAGQPGAIAVTAGAAPGFYRFTVTGKTPSGQKETQSGWIVVGTPGVLPGR